MNDFYNKYQRLPTNREPELHGLAMALYRGEWKEFGYSSWNDILIKEFGTFNTKMNFYTDKKGIENALQV